MSNMPAGAEEALRKRVITQKTLQHLKETGQLGQLSQLGQFEEFFGRRPDMRERVRAKQQYLQEPPARELVLTYQGQSWSFHNVQVTTVNAILNVLNNPVLTSDTQGYFHNRGSQSSLALPPGLKDKVQQVTSFQQQQQRQAQLFAWSQQERKEAMRGANSPYGMLSSKSLQGAVDAHGQDQPFSMSGQQYSSGNQDMMDRLPPVMSNGSVGRNGSTDMGSLQGSGFPVKNDDGSGYMMSSSLHSAVAGRLPPEPENGLQVTGYGRMGTGNSVGQGGLASQGSRNFMNSFPSSSPRSPHDAGASAELFEQLSKHHRMKQMGMNFDQQQNGLSSSRHAALLAEVNGLNDPKTPAMDSAGSPGAAFFAARMKSNGSLPSMSASRMMALSDQVTQRNILQALEDPFGNNSNAHGPPHPSANNPASPAMYSTSSGYGGPTPSSGQYKSPDCPPADIGNRQNSLNSAYAINWAMQNTMDIPDRLLQLANEEMGMNLQKNPAGSQEDALMSSMNRQPTPSGGLPPQGSDPNMPPASPYNMQATKSSLSARSPGGYVPAQAPSITQNAGSKRPAPSNSSGPAKSGKTERQPMVPTSLGLAAALSPHATSLQGDGLGDLSSDQLINMTMSSGFPESSLSEL